MKAPTRHASPTRKANSRLDRLLSLPARLRWTGVALLVLSVIFIGWLGYEAYQAKSNLEQAQSSARQTKDALLSGKSDEANRFAEIAQFHAHQAQTATHSPPWNVVSAIPILGSPLKTTQQIAEVVVGLANNVLLPGATMGAGLSPDKLIDGTRLDLKLLRAEQPRLTELAAAAANLDSQAKAISEPAYLSVIRDARSHLQGQTSKMAELLSNTSIAAQLAPSMLGADGPRTYLMGFQTPAEARGTGGLLGGFGILRFDDGIPTVNALGSNVELSEATAEVDLGPEFNKVYGWANPLTNFRNSNLSPHFPYAAQIWKSMWERQSGETVDGVIVLDPVVLSYVLGAIGPVTLTDGEVISADNVVELTMSTAYSRFSAEKIVTPQAIVYKSEARKRYLQDIAGAVVKKLAGPLTAPRQLLDALGRAVGEGRLSVWSASPADQKLLEETALAHVVPNDAGPYAQVIINNLAGNKMDYYLEREIEYAADDCDGDMRNSTITVRLLNTATIDRPLPDDVAGTLGITGTLVGVPPTVALNAPSGTMVTSVRVIATKGARLLSVTSNGKRTMAIPHVENGHPSFEVQVAIPPGQSAELSFRLSEPTSLGDARVPIQPLIDNVNPKVSVPTCVG